LGWLVMMYNQALVISEKMQSDRCGGNVFVDGRDKPSHDDFSVWHV
jgi:hypothetical protein